MSRTIFIFLIFSFHHSLSQRRPDEGYDFEVNRRFDISYVRSTKHKFLEEYRRASIANNADSKLETIRKLSFIYLFEVPPVTDSCLYWANELIDLSKKRKSDYYLIEGIIKKAEYMERFKNKYEESIQLNNEALRNNNITTPQKLFVKRCIAAIYSKTDNPKAEEYIKRFISEIESDPFLTQIEKARDLYNLSISLGDFHKREKQHLKALNAYSAALVAVFKFNTGVGPAYLYASIAQEHLELGDYKNTDKYLNLAKSKFDSLRLNDFTLQLLRMRLFAKQNEYEKVIDLGESILKKGKERDFKRYSLIFRDVNSLLYEARKKSENYETSLGHFEEYVIIRDSIDRQKRAKEIDEIQKRFDIELLVRENEKEILAKNNEIKNLQLSTFQQKLTEQNLEEKLLREQYSVQKITAESQSKNLEVLKHQNASEKSGRENLELKLKLEEEKRILQLVGSVFLILMLTGIIVWILVRLKENTKYGKLKIEYQERIAQIEVMALRSQMNPHFIFNCLNGIILFIDKNENDQATNYLTKFSKLIRSVLDNSSSETISLKQELKTIILYLQIEQMRFGKKLNYTVDVEDTLDTENILIPPMIIQPFVENAIWHGLMHKPAGGEVRLSVGRAESKSDMLLIEITDNGIGREKAAELKSKSAIKHKSFGMKITTERIEMLNKLYNTASSIEVFDLKNNKNEPIGTRIKIEFPI